MTFGSRLKALRSESGKTLEEVGKAIGVSRQYLSNIENDHKTPGKNVIGSLADYFNVTVDYLMGKSTIRNPSNLDKIYKRGYYAGARRTPAPNDIPIYDAISCGAGKWVEENMIGSVSIPDGYIRTGGQLFANEASGDSMYPTIDPSDLLIFATVDALSSGQIGAFCYNGEYYCKRFKDFNGDIWLYSDNTEYEPIHITDFDNFRILGVLKCQITKRNSR